MASDQLDMTEIRKRAEARVRKRGEFIQHVGIYIVVNLFLWIGFGLFALVTGGAWGWLLVPLLSTLGWGVGVAIHAITTYFETGMMERMREREIDREIQRERSRRGIAEPDEMPEKPKREQMVRLTDDGELAYEDEPERRTSKKSRK